MMRSLWTAATGMVAQQSHIDVLSNNLANVNTQGFKKSRVEFEDLMYQTMRIAGSETQGGNKLPTGMQIGMGVKEVSIHKFFSQGSFESTGNPLDVALKGRVFSASIVTAKKHTPVPVHSNSTMKAAWSLQMVMLCSPSLSFRRKP